MRSPTTLHERGVQGRLGARKGRARRFRRRTQPDPHPRRSSSHRPAWTPPQQQPGRTAAIASQLATGAANERSAARLSFLAGPVSYAQKEASTAFSHAPPLRARPQPIVGLYLRRDRTRGQGLVILDRRQRQNRAGLMLARWRVAPLLTDPTAETAARKQHRGTLAQHQLLEAKRHPPVAESLLLSLDQWLPRMSTFFNNTWPANHEPAHDRGSPTTWFPMLLATP